MLATAIKGFSGWPCYVRKDAVQSMHISENSPDMFIGENQKGRREEDGGKRHHDNLRQTSRHFMTICDIL